MVIMMVVEDKRQSNLVGRALTDMLIESNLLPELLYARWFIDPSLWTENSTYDGGY